MRKQQLILAVGLFLGGMGCQQDKDSLVNDGQAPQLIINDQVDFWSDTTKINTDYVLSFELQDVGPIKLWSTGLPEGKALLRYQDRIVNENPVELSSGSGQFHLRTYTTGMLSFALLVEDGFGNQSEYQVSIYVFDNLLPQAVLELSYPQEFGPYHVRLDGSKSVDLDALWGGEISQYTFTIEGLVDLTTDRSRVDYIFPGEGTYKIYFRVQDNEGAWSDQVATAVIL